MALLKWQGSTVCDICKKPIEGVLYDARTKFGPWATMDKMCWLDNRMSDRIGTGSAQKYIEQQPGKFVKSQG